MKSEKIASPFNNQKKSIISILHKITEPEFCKGLNTTCPVSGPTPVSYDFSFATDNWGRTHIGSRPETLVLQQSEGVNMLKFTMNFRVFDN